MLTALAFALSLAQAAPGPVMVRAVEGLDAGSLESRVWLDAVSRQLERQGFTVVADAPRERSKDADPDRLAEEMASALFAGFPGESGATIAIR